MLTWQTLYLSPFRIFLAASLCVLGACSGSNGNIASPTIAQSPLPVPVSQDSITISLAKTGPVALPSTGGVNGTISLPGSNASPATTLTVSVSAKPPSILPNIPAKSATAFEYFSLTSSADVTFHGFPKISLTLPAPPKSQGQFYVWMYDSQTQRWTDLGTVTVSGTSLAFGDSAPSVTLKGGVAYVAIPFTAAPSLICPTPGPTPTPGPVPTGPKIYATTGFSSVKAFDDEGHILNPVGGFPNLDHSAAITFDTINRCLYLFNYHLSITGEVKSYDENGDVCPVSGFHDLIFPSGIAFDEANDHLYFTDSDMVKIYDAEGNRITSSGNFPNYGEGFQHYVAIDSIARRVYVTKELPSLLGTVLVYDEDGNQLTTSGAFAVQGRPTSIAVDPAHHRIYVGWQPQGGTNIHGNVAVYDDNGNQITTNGDFFDGGNTYNISLAFDAANGLLYIGSTQDEPIRAYDSDGHNVPTTGNFQQSAGLYDITFVPQ